MFLGFFTNAMFPVIFKDFFFEMKSIIGETPNLEKSNPSIYPNLKIAMSCKL